MVGEEGRTGQRMRVVGKRGGVKVRALRKTTAQQTGSEICLW